MSASDEVRKMVDGMEKIESDYSPAVKTWEQLVKERGELLWSQGRITDMEAFILGAYYGQEVKSG